jgi:hypothetical protein
MITQENLQTPRSRIEILREKIDNEDYLYEAIQRIAQVISDDVLERPLGGRYHERQRKERE